MAIILQALPRQTDYNPMLVAAGSVQRPAWGGPIIPIERTGDCWAWEVTVPPLEAATCGAGLTADLAQGRLTLIAMAIPEPGVAATDWGAPLVNGASQQGTTLSVKGLTVGAVIPKRKWLSVVQSGQRYSYHTTAQVTVPVGGIAALPIWPMIRRSPAADDVVELAAPMVEGFVTMSNGWTVRRFGSTGVSAVSFRLEEQE